MRLLTKRPDELANEVRTLLRKKFNEKKEARVAILVENHSILQYAYMLGILKAGNTYVPLDAKAISERSIRILEISSADLLLTEKGFEKFADMAENSGIMKNENIIFTSLSKLKGMKRQTVDVNEERTAYIIFTSGSTGEPKGVEVQDKAVLNFAFSIISKLNISSEDKTLSLSNFSFDASVFDMYPFLFTGAEIIMISEAEKQSIASLNSYMIENGVTIQCVTTALYHLLLNVENAALKNQYFVFLQRRPFHQMKNQEVV